MQEVRTNQCFVGKLMRSQFFIFPFVNYNDKRRTAEWFFFWVPREDSEFFCPTLLTRRKTSFSISLPNSKHTISIILFTKMTLSTLLILAVYRTRVIHQLRISPLTQARDYVCYVNLRINKCTYRNIISIITYLRMRIKGFTVYVGY